MPLESILYVAFVLAVMGVFAAVLTYAEWATRQAMRSEASAVPQVMKGGAACHDDALSLRKAA